MQQINRKFPGKSAAEIYAKVDEMMRQLAQKLSLHYQNDGSRKSGQVSKMGISGTYQVRDGEVVVDLKFPMLVPGTMRRKVEEDVERRLDELFA
jgi:hypothetical protein